MRRLTKFALIAALTGLVMLPFVRRAVTIPDSESTGRSGQGGRQACLPADTGRRLPVGCRAQRHRIFDPAQRTGFG